MVLLKFFYVIKGILDFFFHDLLSKQKGTILKIFGNIDTISSVGNLENHLKYLGMGEKKIGQICYHIFTLVVDGKIL